MDSSHEYVWVGLWVIVRRYLEGLAQAFAGINSLAVQCRFNGCRDEMEPGCRAQAAVQAGTLEMAWSKRHRKLLCEQEFRRRKVDPEARPENYRRIKQLTTMARGIYKHKKIK